MVKIGVLSTVPHDNNAPNQRNSMAPEVSIMRMQLSHFQHTSFKAAYQPEYKMCILLWKQEFNTTHWMYFHWTGNSRAPQPPTLWTQLAQCNIQYLHMVTTYLRVNNSSIMVIITSPRKKSDMRSHTLAYGSDDLTPHHQLYVGCGEDINSWPDHIMAN